MGAIEHMHSKENDPLCQALIERRYGQTVHLQQDIFHSWSDLQELVDPSTFLATLSKEQAMQLLATNPQTLCFPCRSHSQGQTLCCEIGQPDDDKPPDISLEVAEHHARTTVHVEPDKGLVAQGFWFSGPGFWESVFFNHGSYYMRTCLSFRQGSLQIICQTCTLSFHWWWIRRTLEWLL